MNISVISTAQQAQDIDFNGKIAVVIDVLRATSVITTALDNGADEVIPVKTVEEAQSLYATCNAANTLRGGERNALKIEDFDLANSPLEYKKRTVEGKTVILTTTNGTNAINNVQGADEVILGCFRNMEVVSEYLVGLSHRGSRDIVIVCAGTEGQFSLDDGLCAGMLIELIKQKVPVETDDLGLLLAHYYVENQSNLLGALAGCHHVKRLFTLGFYDDIKFCLETNRVKTVPKVENGVVRA
jgi:2-phosphosulfolactate phosphatase